MPGSRAHSSCGHAEVYQLAAFSGALIIGLELTLRFWSFQYVDWFTPGVLIAILVPPVSGLVPAGVRAPAPATRRPSPAPLPPHSATGQPVRYGGARERDERRPRQVHALPGNREAELRTGGDAA